MAQGTIQGTSAELLEQPGSPHEIRTAAGRVVTRVFHYAGAGNPPVDAIGTLYDGLPLDQVDIEWLTKISKQITYSYKDDALNLGLIPYSQLSETSQEFDSATMEIPIEQHPEYNPDPVTGWAVTKPGVTSYLDPQPVRRDVNYQTTFDDSVTGIGNYAQNGYGVLWLFTRMSCRKIGVTRQNGGAITDVYERVREYQYARNGWDGDIYNWIGF